MIGRNGKAVLHQPQHAKDRLRECPSGDTAAIEAQLYADVPGAKPIPMKTLPSAGVGSGNTQRIGAPLTSKRSAL